MQNLNILQLKIIEWDIKRTIAFYIDEFSCNNNTSRFKYYYIVT